MKKRRGFVSNSSSCSYTIFYKDGALLNSAEEIYDYVSTHKNPELYLLGKEIGEGHDYTFLNRNHIELIRRFPDQWKSNRDSVKALIGGQDLYYMKSEYSSGTGGVDISKFPHRMKFYEDNSCYYEEEDDLVDFYGLYFLDQVKGDFDLPSLPEVYPYALTYRNSFHIESEDQWNSIIQCPDSYPLVLSFGNKDYDFVRAMTLVGAVPDFEASYRDYVFIPSKEVLSSSMTELISNPLLEVFTQAFVITEASPARFYKEVFHVTPMFGAYSILSQEEAMKYCSGRES